MIADLAQEHPGDALSPEAEPIRNLRAYSNYLSPKVGLLSGDVWTIAATYLRNLILNLLILIPMLLGILMIPRICVGAIGVRNPGGSAWIICLVLAALAFMIAIRYLASDLPSHGAQQGRREGTFVVKHLLFLLLSAVLLSTAWALLPEADRQTPWWKVGVYLAGAGAATHLLGWLLGYRRQPVLAVLGALLIGGLGGFGIGVAFTKLLPLHACSPRAFVVLATPCVLAVMMLAGILLVGVESFHDKGMRDEDREWFARAGGWILISISVWLVMASVVLYVPQFFSYLGNNFGGWVRSAVMAAGGFAGIASALIGWSAKTAHSDATGAQSKLGSFLAHLASEFLAPVFVVSLLALLSLATGTVLKNFSIFKEPLWAAPGLQFIVAACMFGVGWVIGWVFSVNRFSMNAFYRNRLIRAYLGASRMRSDRKPHRFTGFDPADNLALDALKAQSPLHVLNLTLNLTAGKELAWQNRKAVSFTASPLHVGSSYPKIGYLDSVNYTSGGLTLGSALTISGAAANPNCGYSSSAALTFLMALFDVRLGAWLPNPGKLERRNWTKDNPNNPFVLVQETLGMTDADHAWVNLSDGGHFENLALYEMVRRRPAYIVVSDGSEDHTYNFESLANALQKIRVDLGIRIEPVTEPQIWKKDKPDTKRCALYRIRYSDVDQAPGKKPEDIDGWLLYIKPGVTGKEPRDILKYSNEHADFPHETTVDQWFTEAQFESYRMLGKLSVEEICGSDWQGDIGGFFDQAEAYLSTH